MDIPRESIESRDDEGTARGTGFLEGSCKPGSQQERVLPSAGLDVLIPGDDRESFALAEVLDVEALSSQAQAASTLLLSAHSQVADGVLH